MGNQQQGVLVNLTDGSLTGNLPPVSPLPLVLGPSTSKEYNSIHFRPHPIACWKISDIRFAFDSSFVTPAIAKDIKALLDLRELHKSVHSVAGETMYPPLSVFGHTDDIGTDDYNKALSGRRAKAIYALLLVNLDAERAVSLWRDLAATEHWGREQYQTIRASIPAGTSHNDMYKAYMQSLCPATCRLTAKDFLAQGADPEGKGDYQGCSSFNPMLISSQNAEKQYATAVQYHDQLAIAARRLANSANRRVVVLLFRCGSQVLPAKWPCPRAEDRKDGCIKRFWSDASQRRYNRVPDQERYFGDTQDTFACRFYHRLTSGAPCDGSLQLIKIRLLDAFANPIPRAPYQIELPGGTRKGQADQHGWLQEVVSEMPSSCNLRWGYPDYDKLLPKDNIGEAEGQPMDSIYRTKVFLCGTKERLANCRHDVLA